MRPTLSPGMLLGGGGASPYPPFNRPSARWFYFGRNAIRPCVELLELEGAEILVPAYHHGVEIEALIDAGAQPVFYAVGANWNADLSDLRRRLTPRTRALYLIHYAGFPGPVRELRELADERGIALIEDCALALLSRDGSVPLGTVGDAGIFSLHKTLPTPDGGALVFNGARRFGLPEPEAPGTASTLGHALTSMIENLRFRGGPWGRLAGDGARAAGRAAARALGFDRIPVGSMHFDPARAWVGISSLSLRIAGSIDMTRVVERRRRNYAILLERLRGVRAPLMDAPAPGVCPLFYPLTVENKREALARLAAAGVEAGDFWNEGHPSCDPAEFPGVRRLREAVIELPCHQDLDDDDAAAVAAAARDALGRGMGPRRRRAGALSLSVVRDPASFASLRREWNELMERSRAGVFNSWNWLYPWRRRLAPGLSPYILTTRGPGGALEGLFPLALERSSLLGKEVRRLCFLGEGEAGSDYLDAVGAEGREAEILRVFARGLLDHRADWDLLDLAGVPERSPSPGLLGEAFRERGFSWRSDARFLCPYERFKPGENFESFLARTKRRGNFLRRRNWLRGRDGFRVEVASEPGELARPLEEFFRLQALRWSGDESGITSARMRAFQRDTAALLAERGKLRLYVLRLGGRALAAVYGIVHGGTFHYYQSGFDPAWSRRSVGLVLLGEVFEDAFRLGLREFDFLRGDEAYKSDWVSMRRGTLRLRSFVPGGAGAWRVFAEDAAGGLRSGLKRALPAQALEAARGLRGLVF